MVFAAKKAVDEVGRVAHQFIALCVHQRPISSFVGQAILLEAVLAFLGLGVQEPTPAWGLMLKSGAEEYAESAPWIPIFPGLAISLAVFGFNLFGDALRDALDPKLRAQ